MDYHQSPHPHRHHHHHYRRQLFDHFHTHNEKSEKPHYDLPKVTVTDTSKVDIKDPVEAQSFQDLNKVDAQDAAVPPAEIVNPEPVQNVIDKQDPMYYKGAEMLEDDMEKNQKLDQQRQNEEEEEVSRVSEELRRTTEQNKYIPYIEPQPETPKKKKKHPHLGFDEPVMRILPDRVVITQLYGHQPVSEMQQAKRKPRVYMVACDFSSESVNAIEWTMGTMMRDRDEVHILTVVPPDDSSSQGSSPANQLQGTSISLCDKARDILKHMLLYDIKMVVHAIRGHVKEVLISMIYELPLTMVVCGSRGRSGMKGLLVGSISNYLIQKSPVPVSVIRKPKTKSKVKKTKAAHPAPLSESVRTGQLVVDELGSKSKHER
ncbi:hypothetical protein LRAMOSA00741 [Lichtheimia ramosa]|uniref:UspA domain-containing protein n=1 Tax=Lichtheimia ramosa TaxID=688394 RepID=A0A077W9R4_9FUNG|nr:hypothetical protein LRAMOSA00741 [Lichtheimia ramosa]